MHDYCKEVDCVVIGAGNGGLTAGITLAQKGVKTLMLERHNIPGGYASSFKRGRFEFEVALHEISGIGTKENPGDIQKLFDRCGSPVPWYEVPEAYRVISDDGIHTRIDAEMPFGIENYLDKVEELVPGSRPVTERLFALCKEVVDAINYLAANQEDPDLGYILMNFSNFIKTASYTVDEVYEALEVPLDVQRILNAYWSYVGTSTKDMGFTIYGLMMYTLINDKAFVPDHYSHNYTSAFEKVFRMLGGELWYNTKVDKVLVEDGRVQGVVTSRGEKIKCKYVISNATPLALYNKMIEPRSAVPAEAYKNINARKLGFSCFVVYLGLDKSPKELGIKGYSTMLFTTPSVEEAYQSYKKLEASKQPNGICISNVYPDASPEGTTSLAFCFLQDAAAWDGVEPKDYFDIKQKIAYDTIRQYEELAHVSIMDSIEELEVATPVTMVQYTDAYNGVVYGFEQQPWDSLIARLMTMNDEKYIKGLEFAGAMSKVVHGYQWSLMSGEMAAADILKLIEEEKEAK